MLKEVNSHNGGVQKKYLFENGYGASVIMHQGSYGYSKGLWELAVLDTDGSLCYDTPIAGDVIGHLNEEEVNKILSQIEEL